MNKILFIIPAYNCEKQIARVISQFTPEIIKYVSEILVIDNISQDQTINTAIKALKNLKNLKATVIKNHKNYGLGGSQKIGFQYALEHNYPYVGILHGDDQGNIKDCLPYFQNKEYEKYDCFLGARFMKDSRLEGYSFFRTFGNYFFNSLFSLCAGRKLYDLGSGLNLYKTKIFADNFHKNFPNDLTFNYCLILAHVYYNHNFKFFPISWKETDQISNVKLFKQTLKLIKILRNYLFVDKKLNSFESSTLSYDYEIIFKS